MLLEFHNWLSRLPLSVLVHSLVVVGHASQGRLLDLNDSWDLLCFILLHEADVVGLLVEEGGVLHDVEGVAFCCKRRPVAVAMMFDVVESVLHVGKSDQYLVLSQCIHIHLQRRLITLTTYLLHVLLIE